MGMNEEADKEYPELDYEVNEMVSVINKTIEYQCNTNAIPARQRADVTYDALTICLRDVIGELMEQGKDE